MRPPTVTRWFDGTPIWSRPVEPGELEALARTDVAPLNKRMDELHTLARETDDRQVRAGIANQRERLADHIEAIKAARVSLERTARQRLRNHENYVQRLPDFEVIAIKELLAELERPEELIANG